MTSVPRHLPSSATHLDLSYNHIPNLSPRDFENLHSLEELTMWIAGDLHIDSGTFVGLQRLRSLRFLGNGYLTFGKETFKHLSSLQTLEIPIKSVTHMPEYVFSNLTNLSKLSIRVPAQVKADYTLLPPSLLRGLRYLEEFSFDGSSLANLSRESFADSQNLKKVHIELLFLECGQIEILNSLKNLKQ
ncbi:leucine-rich repeat and immunoglobulin-like domain-containing nogo receptor-interacting protein 3 [Ptychodera flava]|uniref:leucine-rich repeat and immunoglobulin-like domain-containing nogo receptor-interacting protein 3 n=1 Tax=Ptychodera flava TaxID=63121 RepID=UPI003969D8D2